MSLLVKCKCGKTLSVKPESAGKKGKCPGCGTLFTIPAAANPESPSMKDPFDIPFASASANPGNDAFWNELQRSGSSTNSNAELQERVGPENTNRSPNGYLRNAMRQERERESRERQRGKRTRSPEITAVSVMVLLLCILTAPIALYFLYDSVTFMSSDGYTSVVEAKQKYNPNVHTVSQMSDSDIAILESLNRKSAETAEKSRSLGLISQEEYFEAIGRNLKLRAEQLQSIENKRLKDKAELYDDVQAKLIGSPIVLAAAVLIAGVCFSYLLRPSE